jgi:hypothetical protein
MSETQERAQQLIIIWEHMREHPGMYIARNRDALLGFLNGLSYGSSLANVDIRYAGQILQEHGWDTRGAMHVSYQMEEQGYTINEIINETLLMHIETLKQRYNLPDTAEKQD